MKIFQNEGFGEKRTAFVGDKGVERIIFHRDLSLNFGDWIEAKITAFCGPLHGYFAETDRGQVFIPTETPMCEGDKISVQITKEARGDKVATAHPVTDEKQPVDVVAEPVSDEQMDEWVAEALKPDVRLAGQGELHIQKTKVCWTIDVDTAGADSLSVVNQTAIPEIFRQIKLKNMGGLILIDFAGRKRGTFRKNMELGIREALKSDDLCADGSWTKAGLFEIERRRERTDLWMLCSDENPIHIYYQVRRALAKVKSGNPRVRVAPDILKLLNEAGLSAKVEPVFDKPLSYFEILEK